MNERYLMANGLRLAYQEYGAPENPAIILIMGLGTQMIAWPEALCQGLADCGYRVIRFDNRDIGLSQKIETAKAISLPAIWLKNTLRMPLSVPYTLRDMAADTIGLLDALDIQQAHWVGASMGGMIAQILAAQYPARTLSLTSIMSTSGNPDMPAINLRVLRQLLSRPSQENEEAYLKHALKTWALIGSPDYPPQQEELSERILASVRRSYYPTGFKHHLAAIYESGDRRGLLRRINAPTLVIHGKADVLVPVEGGIDTASHIKQAQLKLINGMGHDLPKELIPRFVRFIDAHLKDNES